MKRAYSKPSLYVEPIKLDTPIAANCIAEKADMKALITLGYFVDDRNCEIDVAVDLNAEVPGELQWNGNTICYHSNVQTAFLS